MKRPAILPLLLAVLTLSACSGSDEMALREGGSYAESAPAADVAGTTAPDGSLMRQVQAPASATQAPSSPAAQPDFVSVDTVALVPPPGTVPGEAAVSLNPMLVRTGQAVLRVDSLEQGISRVRQLVAHVGGIVGNTTISAGSDEVRRAEMELRIPSANFAAR